MSGLPTPQKPRRIELATHVVHEEAAAANGNVLPGMLLQRNSTGTVQPHGTEGGYHTREFAKEEALVSRNDPAQSGGASSVDTAYASGALVPILEAKPGDRVNAILKAGVSYAVADYLMSDGAGRMKKATSPSTGVTVKQIVGQLDEYSGAVNLTATGAVDTRASIRIV